ncbi:hypothetical protein Ndes2526B_g05463 [Nannochloris sp. 'desiccata']|nr:hypothetical protein KSW81_007334 [Chlorella desiccata (nom. nud.)]KAH7618559.1 hypothetical protein NADE_005408 [Chlorella desiccata (nom. nud.)]
MPAGVAYDGSVWVTAAGSVGLVMASVGLAVGGGVLIAKQALKGEGMLGPPPAGSQAPEAVQRRRSMPLEKSGDDRTASTMPPPAKSVDTIDK